jgi:release factor glutamine methyltransferase
VIVIQDILNKYSKKLDRLDLELIIAHVLGKNREFILTHPEFAIAKNYELRIMDYANRRMKCEPLAYILGEKEFYGLKFKVNKNTLIPRPETEMMVDLAIQEISKNYKLKAINLIDIGTGSGNIIIATAKQLQNFEFRISNFELFGIDNNKKALKVSEQNAKYHKIDKKIKFLHGNLLNPIVQNSKFNPPAGGQNSVMIITANLPYLSPEIYKSCSKDIKKYEPKSALISQKEGLDHYNELLKQILVLKQNCSMFHASCFMEISPEQKLKITKLIKKYFPSTSWRTKIIFHKDLSGRWRICELEIFNYQ